ncbi:ABC transporter substrate-binding protein [Acidianus brierleyi]|uniref:ABC transporter substrate-binding protein n=1 Tax=Acidianus brierleyi TaxID=41673 RepID=A0A2U9IDR1_9CREN|nr:ABC transporter substrate-binding protein [Acidianus brierleyi]AWR94173.1 ABC transporter substrate-binding protein [Acidianus brierleyi]
MKSEYIAILIVVLVAIAGLTLYDYIKTKSPSSVIITAQQNTQRIVSLAPSDTQILVSLGLGKHIIGIDEYSYQLLKYLNMTSQLPSNVTIFQQIYPPNISGIVSLNPTKVVGEIGLLGSYVGKLNASGLHLVLTNNDYASNFYQIEDSIKYLGNIFNSTNQSQELINWMNSKISNFTTSGNSTVAYLLWICPNEEFYTAGGNTFISNIISLSGGINVFAGYSDYPVLDPSQLIESNPHVIIVQEIYNVSYTEYLISHLPGIQNVTAYKEHRIYILSEGMPANLMNEPGPLAVYSIQMIKLIINGEAPQYINTSWIIKNINPDLPVF